MENGEVTLIDRIEAPGAPHLATWVGKRMGLHCTALGKALIAELPADVLDELIRKQGLIRYNENTISSRRALRLACEAVQQSGYAIDDEEEEIGVRCIGAPVRDTTGEVIAAISISGGRSQLENIAARAAQVMGAAASLSRQIGGIVRDRQQSSRGLPQAFQTRP
jgi:DNA-binding IclR family transcriptional regulator